MTSIPTVTYVVMDNNTLGYIQPPSIFLNILHGKDGGHDWKKGVVSMFGSTIRPATKADFDAFNVSSPPGLITVSG